MTTTVWNALPLLATKVEQGPLRWASLPPAWLLTVLVIVGFFWIRGLYSKERGNAGPFPRLVLTTLRVLVLFLIVLVLGGPYRQEERRVVERSHLVVLLDTSASMEVKDKYPRSEERKLLEAAYPEGTPRPSDLSGVSRAELARRVLAPEDEALLNRWSERFVVHAYAFDADWRSLGTTARKAGEAPDSPSDAELVDAIGNAIRTAPADGGRTRLGAALRNVANEFARRQDQHLAGVVLISDGRDTSDGEPPQQVLATMGVVKEKLRVAAVGMGNPASGKNMWVERIRAKDWVLVRDKVVFETAVRHTGFNDPHSQVLVDMQVMKVADEDGSPIEPRPYNLPRESIERTTIDDLGDEGTPAPVRLQAPFNETGTFQVTIRAKFDGEDDQALDSVPEDDATTHEVRVVDQRIKVLYVDNLPRHDWRFLSNYLTREPGQVQESRDAEARSRFQVHVLLQEADPGFRQPASLGETPLRHFPRTRSELFAYDVIILGDVDWRRFDRTSEANSAKILELIAEFVEEGGGLALQAGVDYKNPIDFLGTPLAQLLPVNVETSDKTISDNMDKSFNLELTPAGMTHPIFAVVPGAEGPGSVATPEWIAATWRGEVPLSERWRWFWLYRSMGGLRPGAIDLARVGRPAASSKAFQTDRGEPLVVFATMGFGRGQVFWSSLDTISKIRRGQRDRVYGAFWEQVIRYLATYRLLGGNKRFKIFTDKDEYFVGETATITITALDDKFEPLDDDFLDGVRIEIGDDPTTAETTLLEGDARPRSMREDGALGTYRLQLPLKKRGLVRVWIDRGSKAGRGSKDRAEKRFEVRYRAREDILKVPDHQSLADIMRLTNPELSQPEVYKLHEMAKAVEDMQERPRERVLDRRERSQWDKTWVLLLITGLLALEWLLRKRWQMI